MDSFCILPFNKNDYLFLFWFQERKQTFKIQKNDLENQPSLHQLSPQLISPGGGM